jgi:hypothetical protein
MAWASYRKKADAIVWAKKVREPTPVTTIHGDELIVKPGDYLCQNGNNEHDRWPCNAQVFKETYERAS